MDINKLLNRLWPICRSIMGNGYRESLDILSEFIPFQYIDYKTGENVFDWTIPKEWNIKEAWIKNSSGKKIVDFNNSNLHIVNYSLPINGTFTFSELDKHLFTLRDMPNAIPYITSYYNDTWGFCISHKQKLSLNKDETYKVFIDSSLKEGILRVGEKTISSTTGSKEIVLFSTYLCHPSMANNELSGPIAMAALYDKISKLKYRKYNYQFVICPETIGSIAFLSKYGEELKKNCIAGMVMTCCGDEKRFTYKKSKEENSLTNRIMLEILNDLSKNNEVKIHSYFPTGSDERQYCSPGLNLPIGSLMRSMYGEYKEYHTSLDDRDFISENGILSTVNLYFDFVKRLEERITYKRTQPYCEPMLSKYQLISKQGAKKNIPLDYKTFLFILNYSDRNYSIDEIAKIANVEKAYLIKLVEILEKNNLIKKS